ncbi:MAG TPA: LacI family DNA-binding transcriptional regulator [Candidatus Dormibacteraeota bacterium]|nr:LacI family DNA-binding transcriptional regulator [Candidatus Dormibacteraeota bacterium]
MSTRPTPGTRRPTINDIATKVGLSKASVSRALNGKQDVDPETRKRIFKIATQMGYVPSATARALSNGRSNCLGLLVPSLTWPWILEVLRGVAEEIERSGYSLMLYTTANGEDSERAFMSQVVPAGAVDGLALVIPPGMFEYIGELAKRGMPVVVIDDRGHHPEFPTVATTNLEGGRSATQHLIDLGRRRIAMLNGQLEFGCNRDRLEGYQSALQDSGIRFESRHTMTGYFTEESGASGIARVLESDPKVDAVFAANDLMAFGAMRAIRNSGRRIPDDVAVVGFDDIPASAITHPPLTTVHQPLYEMGRKAAGMVMAAVRGDRIEGRIELPTSLVVRASTVSES